jgi:hypothetical protein
MALSVFTDKTMRPGEAELSKALGESKLLWDRLLNHANENYSNLMEEWKHYGKSSGWTMKLLMKKRNLFFLYPGEGQFVVGFVFGDKAVQAVEKSSLPQDIIDALKASPKFAEGRGLPVTVKTPQDLEWVKALLTIKIEH